MIDINELFNLSIKPFKSLYDVIAEYLGPEASIVYLSILFLCVGYLLAHVKAPLGKRNLTLGFILVLIISLWYSAILIIKFVLELL